MQYNISSPNQKKHNLVDDLKELHKKVRESVDRGDREPARVSIMSKGFLEILRKHGKLN